MNLDLEIIYKVSPPIFQNILCSLHGYNLKSTRFNSLFYEYLTQLHSTEKKDLNEIISYKESRIEEILSICFNQISFYNAKFRSEGLTDKDFKSLSDLEKFPILNKEDIRENWKNLVNASYSKKKLIHSHTSGSTGKSLDFFLTRESIPYQWAVWWRFRRRFGIDLFDKHLNFTGKTVVPIDRDRPPYWRINYPLNQWLVNMQHISKAKVPDIVTMINKEEFRYFSGYPSIISSFCFFVKELNLRIKYTPEVVFTGAEKLYGQQKNIIQEVLNCKVTDHYGFSEGAGNASKCTNDNYHEDFEFGHLECYKTSETKGGNTGEILATGFSNLGMPLLRYRVGDTATWSNKKCNCGINSAVIENIEGRAEEYIITPEGTRILRFDYLFKDTSSIRECQIVQKETSAIIMRIVKRDCYKLETETYLKRMVKEKISPNILVNFEYLNEIPRSTSGKFRAIISELK